MINKKDYGRILDWYRTGDLNEDDAAWNPRKDRQEWKKPVPNDVYGLLMIIYELTGRHVDEAVVVFTLPRGDGGEEPLEFKSGEIVGGRFLHTLATIAGDTVPQPMPFGFMANATMGDIDKDMKKATEKAKTMEYAFVVDGREHSIKRVCMDTMQFPGDQTTYYFVNIQLSAAGARPKKNAPLGGSTYSKDRPDRVKDFIREITRMQKESGRSMMDEPVVCRCDDDSFSCIPSNSTEGQSTFILQKLTDPAMTDECWTFRQIGQWMFKEDHMNSVMFFKSGPIVYEIESIEYEAGRPPVLQLRPWGGMDESAKQILEWKKYCDDELLYW